MITEGIVQVQKTARFYSLGEVSGQVTNLWFVFHGYGQLAAEFIKEFTVIKSDSTIIIAPEALNKFYLRGFSGKIGATWMTKEDRENEINDYVKMIDNIYKKILSQLELKNIKINVFGFSQGTNTAARWLNYTKTKVDNLILWSGALPHDCDYKKNIEYWTKLKLYLILGRNDKFLTNEIIEKEKKFIKSHNINYYFYKFNGGHEIDKKVLLDLSKKLK